MGTFQQYFKAVVAFPGLVLCATDAQSHEKNAFVLRYSQQVLCVCFSPFKYMRY